jgi:hypothetical protein
MSELNQNIAHRIIQSVASAGQPPEYGFQYFSVGLDQITQTIEQEYLNFFIKNGGSSFKVVIGGYGSGKTHFLYTIRELAWDKKYATSIVTLTAEDTPFHKLEAVYRSIVNNLQPPLTPTELLSGTEIGIEAFIVRWFHTVVETQRKLGFDDYELNKSVREWIKNNIKSYESLSFTAAVTSAFFALLENKDEDFREILMWLKGENFDRSIHKKYGIVQKINKETAFQRLRSLGQWIRQIGYNGLVILFDEAEQSPSFTKKQTAIHLNNLRQLIDACQRTSFQGFMFFYAIPDEDFLNQSGQVYEALKQRLATYLTIINPSGVKINLERLFGQDNEEIMAKNLFSVGEKLSEVYSIAYQYNFEEEKVSTTLNLVIEAAMKYVFSEVGVLRQFVQKTIMAFHMMRSNDGISISKEEANNLFE